MVSLGEELKREREFREISLREISDATKINLRMLEAIETNDFKMLPGGIFNRNFIRAYAEFIGLDPEIAVRKYQVQMSEEVLDTVTPGLIHTALVKEVQESDRRNKLIYVLIVILVVGTVLLAFWIYKKKNVTLNGGQTIPRYSKIDSIHESYFSD